MLSKFTLNNTPKQCVYTPPESAALQLHMRNDPPRKVGLVIQVAAQEFAKQLYHLTLAVSTLCLEVDVHNHCSNDIECQVHHKGEQSELFSSADELV